MTSDAEPQLELFELSTSTETRPASATIGTLQIRHDHAVLSAIAGLISVSIVFAFGVERGKSLARAEFPASPAVTVNAQPAMSPRVANDPSIHTTATDASDTVEPVLTASRAAKPAKTAKPPAQKKPAAPVKAASSRSRFAIQVVTYSKPVLAQRELQRLKQRGEQAFLVTKQGRVTLCVGPFPSRENATAKLVSLKQRYQDCFLRTL